MVDAIHSYCREIDAYLCRKNDGHLIRVVGPSFEVVSKWAAAGVPLKVAFHGIDRYFERYYRNGPRRRPVKIDFCEADVLDAFDEWRRATGIVQSSGGPRESPGEDEASAGERPSPPGQRRGLSLPEHLERVLLKLTAARAGGAIGTEFDDLLDRIAGELDLVRADARGLRGAARQAAIDRLAALDTELLAIARRSLTGDEPALAREADDELGGFRATMTDEAYQRARAAVLDRLVRDRFNLPIVSYGS